MFDVGFWELVIIGVVALLLIGPERLPGVARTVGLWVGKTRRFVSSVQADVGRELNRSDDIKKLLEEQLQIKDMHEIIEQTVDDVKKTVAVGNEQIQRTTHQVRSMDVTDDDNSIDDIGLVDFNADAASTDATEADNNALTRETTTGQADEQPEQTHRPSTDTVNDQAK